MTDAIEKDLVRFAFWTCLRLESDILAELGLPHSDYSLARSCRNAAGNVLEIFLRRWATL